MNRRVLDTELPAAYRRALRARLRRRPGAAPLEQTLRPSIARGREARVNDGRPL